MHRIFRDHPEAVGKAFRVFGIDLPDQVRTTVLHTDLTETAPIERRADTVLKVDVEGEDSFLLVIESQRKIDRRKLRSWPYYIAYLYEYYELPVLLVVVCQDRPTGHWAEQPIHVGTRHWTSMSVRPLVLGPHNVPLPEGPIGQGDIAHAVLAAITHGREPGIDGILRRLAVALKETDEPTRTDLSVHTQLGLAGLPAGRLWRALMSFTLEKLRRSPELREILDEANAELRAQAITEGRAEGRAAERAAGVLRTLDKRKVQLTEAQRERLGACTDLDLLERWADAAYEVESAEQLFD